MKREQLRERATFISALRAFFSERDILEVDTPLLSSSTTPDPAIESIITTNAHYLQTSPESFMKRLLAEGSGSIYQLAPAFRAEEMSPIHNAEFLLLEWYRPGFTMEQLMAEVEELVSNFVDIPSIEQMTVAEAFESVGVKDLLDTDAKTLKEYALAMGLPSADEMELDWDGWIDYFMVLLIQPRFAHAAIFLTHYPASQAALARLSPEDSRVAERFELLLNGIEIANGFRELTDAKEQRTRFEKELEKRRVLNMDEVPLDEELLQALASGMPECSGVAVGVDRLMMISQGKDTIQEVMPFSIEVA
ncbi:MAG: EF-P lysine aminoacylase GenX [Thiotrichales bacterium]|jgi:lysyl-tRNA synthetase class 2|nr:EF-P lysine aminoacylase GenX [Thiotrichales bacterium]MBT3612907.1 EF-P lysine aminoacylase GenX [Thiotrichales bacterium]MBT3752322.1 EF-P lysine aminoacylase GenX [Thiotrichales bacterium]MBT3837074.1 EF-P lysine aminoacylase GenX [Thiotrichales bacterium]MBT4152493.1 EF-P lysine aminoacylase GenX [Thiotrichales bacterium]